MTDLELAEEIERQTKDSDTVDIQLPPNQWQQIIAALRRGHEPAIKDETFAEKVKRLQDERAQIDMELSRLL